MTREEVKNKLFYLGLDPIVLYNYDDPKRFYHNWNHIQSMLDQAEKENILDIDLMLAIVFHDVAYDTKASDNEEVSAKTFMSLAKQAQLNRTKCLNVVKAIMETKTHNPTTELSKNLCRLDLMVLNGTMEEFVDFENKIRKEYQWVDLKTYTRERVKILESLDVREEFIDYVKSNG